MTISTNIDAGQPVAWHKGLMAGFDLETTGVDVWSDRVVTAAIIKVKPGAPVNTTRWIADPGVEIPTGASDIHGITTEMARADGRPIRDVLSEITVELATILASGVPVVTMNGSYDFSLLRAECVRHGVEPLDRRILAVAPVVDIRVIDKHVDRYRRGGRKLVDLCAYYEVRLDQAHDAAADVLGSLRVAYKIANKYPQLQIDPHELHRQQVAWAAEQAESFRRYLVGQGKDASDVRPEWPYVPRATPEATLC